MLSPEELANKAMDWIQSNTIGPNECIEESIAKEDRNKTVQDIINVGSSRSRTVQGGLPYGVGRLKSNLILGLGMTADEANVAVSQLKKDERIYHVGRGLGKMLAVFNGEPKAIVGNNLEIADLWLTVAADYKPVPLVKPIELLNEQLQNVPAYPYNPNGIHTPDPAPELPNRVADWLTENKTPRKVIRNRALKQQVQVPPAPQNPAIADYGDLQEIYNEIEVAFREKFAKLRAKCDELAEENMVLNQATWQS